MWGWEVFFLIIFHSQKILKIFWYLSLSWVDPHKFELEKIILPLLGIEQGQWLSWQAKEIITMPLWLPNENIQMDLSLQKYCALAL